MTDDADLWLAPILSQDHAARRVVERVGRPVVGEIRLALLCGRFSARRPEWVGRTARAERYVALYVWDESLVRCYVLSRSEGRLYLVTVLLEQGEWEARAEARRGVRSGSART